MPRSKKEAALSAGAQFKIFESRGAVAAAIVTALIGLGFIWSIGFLLP